MRASFGGRPKLPRLCRETAFLGRSLLFKDKGVTRLGEFGAYIEANSSPDSSVFNAPAWGSANANRLDQTRIAALKDTIDSLMVEVKAMRAELGAR